MSELILLLLARVFNVTNRFSKDGVTLPELPRDVIPMIQTLVDLMKEADESEFHSTHPKVHVSLLDVSNLAIVHDGRPVKNIRYIWEMGTVEGGASDESHIQMHFVLSFKDGKKMLVTAGDQLNSNELRSEFITTLVTLFFDYGKLQVHAPTGDPRKIVWSVTSQEDCYQIAQVTQYYLALYQSYAQHIFQVITADTSNRPVFLVEPGCGDGRCSRFITDYIETHTSREVFVAGFDINAENIARANAKFADPQRFFAIHDFSNMTSFLSDLDSWRTRLKNPLTIVIFSGVLCELVATGSRQSLQMIQHACRELSPGLIVVGHHTESLVSKQMISRTGLQISAQCNGPERHMYGRTTCHDIYFLQPMTAEQYAEKHQIWSDKREKYGPNKDNLDLSMCPHPIQALHNLIRYNATRLESVTQLDLSDALVKPNDIDALVQLIHQRLPKLFLVLFTQTDRWSTPLARSLRTFFPKLIYVNRLDSPNSDSLPPFSVPMARSIKLFDTIPYERLVLPVAPTPDHQDTRTNKYRA